MSTLLELDIKELMLSSSSFGPYEIRQIQGSISENPRQFAVLRDSVAELEASDIRTPAMSVRLGVGQYLLGRFEMAATTLSSADGGALAYYYLGKSNAELKRYDAAIEAYRSAKMGGYNADDCALAIADVYRRAGQIDAALTALDELSGAVEQTAEYLYQRACTVSALAGNRDEVITLLERAVMSDELHSGSLFALALENDRQGNDEIALEYYEKAANRFPAHVGSLLNLGLIYEDTQQYERAQDCYQRILEVFPNEPRARLFLGDAQAANDQFYDEEAQKRRDRLAQVLSIPVSDFELSVRSRNCLQKMGIYTLGDLARCSEQELLTSKNFGETSLDEIRDMLTSKGLQLGQLAHEKSEPEPELDLSAMSPDEQAVLERPISELNLSVRARKCMARLGLNTIGELIRKTGDDMLECKNFGVTSLTEVREKLTAFGLKLRGD
ncbi:MAG: DNA-directed RNA polymerase subunit alpha C-terminal domain-containing protein [Planctomycetota bacterium]